LDNWRHRIDWPLMMAVAALLVIGYVSVFSAVSPTGAPSKFLARQTLATVIGLGAVFVLTGLNYQLFRAHPGVLYVLSSLLLAGLLVFGKVVNGARSWYDFGPISFEPGEIARIGFLLVLAALLDRPERDVETSPRLMAGGFALAAGHIFLILLQPDFGSTLVYIPILLGMFYFGGVRPIYLLAVIFFGALAVGIPMMSTYFSVQPQLLQNHPVLEFVVNSARGTRSSVELLFLSTALIYGMWWFARKLHFRIPWQYPLFLSIIVALGVYTAYGVEHHIKDFQRKRLLVYLSPGFDPLGAGYNILQSEIAIGSGGLFGKGLFSGSQVQLGFLPEKHTDFIYSAIAEEMGFVWAAIVLAAFGLLIWRAFAIAVESPDRFGSLIAAGIGCKFAWECTMNIGMAIGLLPVTGVALPFVSYGGSHVVGAFISIGLLQSINFRRYIY